MNESDGPIGNNDLENLLGELRAMARELLKSEHKLHSVTPTALALSALRRAKLQDQNWEEVRWENRAHFFKMLNIAMRHALIDRARAAIAKKRAQITYLPGNDPVILDLAAAADEKPTSVIALYEGLDFLRKTQPASVEIVELRYMMGYSVKEVAQFLNINERTLKRNAQHALILLEQFICEYLKKY